MQTPECNDECSLAKADNATLTKWFQDHDGDFNEQFHAAIHHVRRQHGGQNSDQWEFFANQSASFPLIAIGESVALTVRETVRQNIHSQLFDDQGRYVYEHHRETWLATQWASEQLADEFPNAVKFGFMAGAVFSAYYFSGGHHCLWGIIDPSLCQD